MDLNAGRRRPGARDPGGRLRLLFLSPFPPAASAPHGSARAVAWLLDALADAHDVGLVYLKDGGEPGPPEALTRRLRWVTEVPRPTGGGEPGARMRRRLRLLTGLLAGRPTLVSRWVSGAAAVAVRRTVERFRPDVVQAEHTAMAELLRGLPRKGPRKVVRVHEPSSRMAPDRPWALALLDLADRGAAIRQERRVLRQVDAAVALTEADRLALDALTPGARIEVVPLAFPLPEALDPGGEDDELLFFGSFAHAPNVTAAVRLARDILPRVRTRCPAARLAVVGSAPPPAVWDLEHVPGVTVTADVPSIRPWLDRAAVVVAPLYTGGGMRVKVLEALGSGKAMVATPLALEGVEVGEAGPARAADSDDAIADAVATLLEDREARSALGRGARLWAEKHVDPSRVAELHVSLYRSLLATGGAGNA